MRPRPRPDEDVETLLNDVQYLWDAQGPAGQARGTRAAVELLYRWDYFGDEVWQEQPSDVGYVPSPKLVATVAVEAENRGYDHPLTLDEEVVNDG